MEVRHKFLLDAWLTCRRSTLHVAAAPAPAAPAAAPAATTTPPPGTEQRERSNRSASTAPPPLSVRYHLFLPFRSQATRCTSPCD
ncbi:hypothetical protein HZH66_008943 [Vespula vulgaris]|uniref:Uncharacterized protein n=1 Tax=Vespula vulgaris TaxID=7454 RepID=A0A834N278_VESVU|nr:hypothetical protein HZH66_008943 [Vespula vulgaris]